MSDSNYLLPEAYLRLPDSKWPEGDGSDCRPADGVSRVGQWSVEREIVGNMLPGQVRARSGLSVGSASARIPQTAEPMTPWSPQAGQRVVPRGAAELFLAETHDGPVEQRLGEWVINPVSGALTSAEVALELVEASSVGKKPEHTLPTSPISDHLEGVSDASWVVAQLAAQLGYGDAPVPEKPLIFVPFTGSPLPSSGILGALDVRPTSADPWEPWSYRNQAVEYTYGTENNVYGLDVTIRSNWFSGARFFFARSDYAPDVAPSGRVTVAFTFSGGDVRLILGPPEVEFYWYPAEVIIREYGSFGVRNDSHPSTTFVNGTYSHNQDPNLPGRVEVQIERILGWHSFGEYELWEATRVRVRSSGSSAWSAWVTSNSSPSTPAGQDHLRTAAIPTVIGLRKDFGFISNFSVTAEPDPGTWVLPEKRLDIERLGKSFVVPYLDGHTSPWDGIQEVCGATLGAAWLDWEGTLKVRNSTYLTDTYWWAPEPSKVIDVDMRLEDIKWVTDPDETADRLEVTYYPLDVEGTKGSLLEQVSPIVWQAEEAYEVRPGETIEVIGYTASPLIAPMVFRSEVDPAQRLWQWTTWAPIWNPDGRPPKMLATWSALPNRNGSGAIPGDGALTVDSRPLSLSRLLIRITNNTNQTLYTVDANGNPHLIYRQSEASFQENTAVVVRGVPREEDSVLPLKVDLTRIVQTKDFAEQAADHIWQRVSGVRWRAESVRIVLDWSLDIGDIVRLQHPQTSLDVKALVTRVALEGSPGEIAQTVDFVILDKTWIEFDKEWENFTWDDFDATWAGQTWDDFDRNPTLNQN